MHNGIFADRPVLGLSSCALLLTYTKTASQSVDPNERPSNDHVREYVNDDWT